MLWDGCAFRYTGARQLMALMPIYRLLFLGDKSSSKLILVSGFSRPDGACIGLSRARHLAALSGPDYHRRRPLHSSGRQVFKQSL